MNGTSRWVAFGGRVPLLWPGLGIALLLWLLVMLQGAGVQVGTVTSLTAVGLTCVGLSLAWGYLIAGATASGWVARTVVALSFSTYLIPSWAAMTRGYSGWILLVGLLVFLVWRWRQHDGQPVVDLLVTGVITLLVYGVIAERTTMLSQTADGETLFVLALSLQAITASYLTGTVMILMGSAVGEMLVGAASFGAGRLVRLPAGVLMAALSALALGKVAWDLSRYTGPAWFTAALLFALLGAWAWFARPRGGGAWPVRQPLVVLAIGLIYVLVSNFGGRLLPAGSSQLVIFWAAVYLAGVTGLVTGAVCLALGRRPAALLAGMAGIWLLLASGNGETVVPLPALAWLSHLPKSESAAIDGTMHLSLLAWAGWLWIRGRRDPGPYAMIFAGMVLWLTTNGLDKVYEDTRLRASWIPLALFGITSLYCLWQVARGAVQREGRQAVAWTGLALGAVILLFASDFWAQISDFGNIYAVSGWPYIGYAMFTLVTVWYGLLRHVGQMTEERGDGV